MKREGARKKPVVRYNVQLPNIPAYIAGMVTITGKPVVHVRMGEFTHVVWADTAKALAESIIEQAEWATKMADVWRRARDNAKPTPIETLVAAITKEPT